MAFGLRPERTACLEGALSRHDRMWPKADGPHSVRRQANAERPLSPQPRTFRRRYRSPETGTCSFDGHWRNGNALGRVSATGRTNCSVLRAPTSELPPVANTDQQPRLSGSQITLTQMAESSALTQAAAVDRADCQSEKSPFASSKVDDINSLCRRLT